MLKPRQRALILKAVRLRDNISAASTPASNGRVYAGSMMNSVDHITGGVWSGQRIWVP